MTSPDAKQLELLQRWLTEHELPTCFPEVSLLPVASPFVEDADLYLRQTGKELEDCVSRIFNSPRTMVHFKPGHGTSTLARAVHDKGRQDSRGLYLIVEPMKLQRAGLSREGIDQVLGNALAVAFLSRDFSNIQNAQSEAELLQIVKFPDTNTFKHFCNQYRATVERGRPMPPQIQKWLDEAGARFSTNIAEISQTLHGQLNIVTLLLFDFSHDTGENDVLRTSRAMKWFEENRRLSIPNFPRMALIEAYFGSTEILNMFQSNWDVVYDHIEIPAYNAEEIFHILTQRFRPKNLRREVPLQTIMHPDFAELAYDPERTLNEILQRMRALILESVDVPKKNMTAQLKPKVRV